MPPISADHPTGEILNEDIAATPGNEEYRRAFEDWQAGGARDFPPMPTYEEWERAIRHAMALRRAQPPRPPLFFGGDPRAPHFLQLPVNPDPARYYRIVESEEEAAAALAEGDLPIVVAHDLLERLPPTVARDLVEQARVRQYELPHAPFRNAVERLQRGIPSCGAEPRDAPTLVPRYNPERLLNQRRGSLSSNAIAANMPALFDDAGRPAGSVCGDLNEPPYVPGIRQVLQEVAEAEIDPEGLYRRAVEMYEREDARRRRDHPEWTWPAPPFEAVDPRPGPHSSPNRTARCIWCASSGPFASERMSGRGPIASVPFSRGPRRAGSTPRRCTATRSSTAGRTPGPPMTDGLQRMNV